MKCQWKFCNGIINPETEYCIMCGRGLNTRLEQQIDLFKAAIKTDWHTNSTDSWRQGKLRRKYT